MLLQDSIVDLDRCYALGVLVLERTVTSLRAEVTDLEGQLAFEVELRLNAEAEMAKQKQLRADEEADYVAEVESHKETKQERDNRIVELQSSNHRLQSQHRLLLHHAKRFRTASIAGRRKARLQAQSAAAAIRRERDQKQSLLERLQSVTTENETLEKMQQQSNAVQLVMQQMLLRLQSQSIRQSNAHAMITGVFKNKLVQSGLLFRGLRDGIQAESACKEFALMIAAKMCVKAMRQTRWHNSLVSKARSKIERLERDLQASNDVLAQTQSQLVASSQSNGELTCRLSQAEEVQSAMRFLLDVVSTRSNRLALRHASLVDKGHSRVNQLQTRIDGLHLDISTHREKAATFPRQVAELETSKTQLETQVKGLQGLQSETNEEHQEAESKIAALQDQVDDFEKAYELTVQSRADILLFIYDHFNIKNPLCTEETIKEDFASQDELVSMTQKRLFALRELSEHKRDHYGELTRLRELSISGLKKQKAQLMENVQILETTREEDLRQVTEFVESQKVEQEALEAKLRKLEERLADFSHKACEAMKMAIAKYRLLESTAESTIDHLKKEIDFQTQMKELEGEFDKLADMYLKRSQ